MCGNLHEKKNVRQVAVSSTTKLALGNPKTQHEKTNVRQTGD
jgi:hypothetical protein